jgi:hypothetical protein
MDQSHNKKPINMDDTDDKKTENDTNRRATKENSTLSMDAFDTKCFTAATDQTDEKGPYVNTDGTDGNHSNALLDQTNRGQPTGETPQSDGKPQEGIPKLASLNISDTKPPPEVPDKVVTTHFLIHEYLMANVPEYNEVHKLRQIVSVIALSLLSSYLPKKAC